MGKSYCAGRSSCCGGRFATDFPIRGFNPGRGRMLTGGDAHLACLMQWLERWLRLVRAVEATLSEWAREWPDIERLLLAAVLGAAIGLEREMRNRAAGLRTMILVSSGSALAMLISQELALDASQGSALRADPTRIAAGVVTGIGFLGGGVILKLGDIIHGVTTAAAIWFAAALGLAAGDGRYALALSATAVALFVLTILRLPERLISSKQRREVRIVVDIDNADEVLAEARRILEDHSVKIRDIAGEARPGPGGSIICLTVRSPSDLKGFPLLRKLATLPGVSAATWK